MNAEEKRLLRLLGIVAAAAGLALAIFLFIGRFSELRAETERCSARIQKLSSLTIGEAAARARLDAVNDRLAAAKQAQASCGSGGAEEGPAFCASVLSLCRRHGIVPASYRSLDAPLYEFSFSCQPAALFAFLREAAEVRGWRFPYADFRAVPDSSELNVVLRLAP